MKKNIVVCGLIGGLILAVVMIVSTVLFFKNDRFDHSMIIGYASMLCAFSLVFVGIKNYRDKYNNGFVSFGKAFKTGLLISLIASTIYVLIWLVNYYLFIPDFMDRYGAYVMKQAAAEGASEAVISQKMTELATYKELYKNPLLVVLLTYAEVLPVGIVISLVCALILKRKTLSPAVSAA